MLKPQGNGESYTLQDSRRKELPSHQTPTWGRVTLSEANGSHHEVSKSEVSEDLTVVGGLMSCILQRKRCVTNRHFYKPSESKEFAERFNSDFKL